MCGRILVASSPPLIGCYAIGAPMPKVNTKNPKPIEVKKLALRPIDRSTSGKYFSAFIALTITYSRCVRTDSVKLIHEKS